MEVRQVIVVESGSQPGSIAMPLTMNYLQIADDLTARIAAGEYPPGSKLPSYDELAELYSVSFSTITRSIGVLRLKRVVVGQPGRGVFVPEADS